jgi:hypothetical protein
LERDIMSLKRQSAMQLVSLPTACPIDNYVTNLLYEYEGRDCVKYFCGVL